MPKQFLLMLEDEADRVSRFRDTVEEIDSELELVIWRTAPSMIAEVEDHLASAVLISLDHDLFPAEGETEDPGDGLEVAKFLATLPPACPVIVHSSNGTRAQWMLGEFELAGWEFERVAPLGDDWIEAYWKLVVQDLLKRRET